MPDNPPASLAAGYRGLDPGEFNAAYRRILFYFAHRLREDAPELTQETFCRHLEWISGKQITITGPDGFVKSLYTVAKNVLLEHYRSLGTRREREAPLEDAEPRSWTIDPGEVLTMRKILSTIPEEERTILQRAEEEEDESLAADLGISVGALRVRLCRLRRKLREVYAETHGRNPDEKRRPLKIISNPEVVADE